MASGATSDAGRPGTRVIEDLRCQGQWCKTENIGGWWYSAQTILRVDTGIGCRLVGGNRAMRLPGSTVTVLTISGRLRRHGHHTGQHGELQDDDDGGQQSTYF